LDLIQEDDCANIINPYLLLQSYTGGLFGIYKLATVTVVGKCRISTGTFPERKNSREFDPRWIDTSNRLQNGYYYFPVTQLLQ